jgi:hypothetical protein
VLDDNTPIAILGCLGTEIIIIIIIIIIIRAAAAAAAANVWYVHLSSTGMY